MNTIDAENTGCTGCADSLDCGSLAIIQEGQVVVACGACKNVLNEIFNELGEPQNLSDLIVGVTDGDDSCCPACGDDFNSGPRVIIQHKDSKLTVCVDCADCVRELQLALKGLIQHAAEKAAEAQRALNKKVSNTKK